MTAPIVLFVFNRPTHTQRILHSLKENFLADSSTLYIIADGPREGMSEKEKEDIERVRTIIKSENWCQKNIIIEKDKNDGLANSIITSVTELLNKHERIIVLEDDLLLSKHALRYFNFSLNHFEKNQNINCIHGYSFPANYTADYFFLKGADCWGWATWKSRWKDFEADGKLLLKKIEAQGKQYEFDFFNSYNFFEMLKEQTMGKNNSWAIKWYAASFLKDKLTLYPKKPFVLNLGNDGSGYHTKNQSAVYNNILADSFHEKELEKIDVSENTLAKNQTANFFAKNFLSKIEFFQFKLKLFFTNFYL
jgi:hypothetical protein